MHLLRTLPGGLPGRCHRRGPELRVLHRDARGADVQQGKAARERRPLGAGAVRPAHGRRAVSLGRAATMIIQTLAFYLFAGITVASGAMVITSRNPVHSVLFLILAFFNSAGLFVLLGAEFLAMI